MLRKMLAALSLATLCSSSFAFDFPQICESGKYHKVSGNLKTRNINEYEQTGQLLLNLYTFEHFRKKLKFSGNGDVHGTIVSQQATLITLNHEIILEEGIGEIYTHGDNALITGITELAKDDDGQIILNPDTKLPTPCGFSVIEQINDISGSTGPFSGASGKISAFGTINMCPQNQSDEVHNQFVLTGYVCLQQSLK